MPDDGKELVPTKEEPSPEKEYNHDLDAKLGAFSDMLFVLLPVLVVAIVTLATQHDWYAIVASSEWSFAASVLFGQALMKLVAIATARASVERSTAAAGTIVVIGLIPSLIILVLVLLAREHVSLGLVVAQLALFGLSIPTFMRFGAAANYLHSKARFNDKLMKMLSGKPVPPGL